MVACVGSTPRTSTVLVDERRALLDGDYKIASRALALRTRNLRKRMALVELFGAGPPVDVVALLADAHVRVMGAHDLAGIIPPRSTPARQGTY